MLHLLLLLVLALLLLLLFSFVFFYLLLLLLSLCVQVFYFFYVPFLKYNCVNYLILCFVVFLLCLPFREFLCVFASQF